MDELLYIKYNSLRKPEYRIATSIYRDLNGKYVKKRPLEPEAERHVDNLLSNYFMLKDYYKAVKPICGYKSGNGINFKFVYGNELSSNINMESIESLRDSFEDIFSIIYDFKEIYKNQFSNSDKFRKIFGDLDVDGKLSVCPANIDSIISNFIRTETGDVVCLDYEWVFDCYVPIDFLKYRAVLYFYNDNVDLRSRFALKDILIAIGIGIHDQAIYDKMENSFQQYVHGDNREYSYIGKFTEDVKNLDEIIRNEFYAEKIICDKEKHIENLSESINVMNKAIHDLQCDVDRLNSSAQDMSDDIIRLNGIIRDDYTEIEHNILEIRKLSCDAVELKKQKMSDSLVIDDQKKCIDKMNNQIQEKERVISELSDKLSKIKKGIVNPLYGIKLVSARLRSKYKANKILRSSKRTVDSNNDIYDKRYKELISETDGDYEKWISAVESNYEFNDIFEYNPKISVLIPVYNVEDRHLKPCIESVIKQNYDNWELVLVDDCSSYDNVRITLLEYANIDSRIKVIFREQNGRISKCTNTAIENASGEYLAFMDCDDLLQPFALYEVVKVLNNDKTIDFIYSDEDKIDDRGDIRHTPFFKPDWSPDTFMSYMYTSHLGVYRANIVKSIGGLRPEFDGCQDYDMTLRFTEITDRIAHIPKILYHWRQREESTALNPEAKDYVKSAAELCKKEAIDRRKQNGVLEWIDGVYQYRIRYIPDGESLISVIIPSKDNPEILRQCVESLRNITIYRNYEIIVVDNGSNEENKKRYKQLSLEFKFKYLYEKMDFNFSYMCNKGAFESNGSYLLFLNDDIEIINPEWLDRMLGQAELPHVGAVGAKLLYPYSTKIQHVGVINIKPGPVHAFAKMDDTERYYFNRNTLDFDVLAVTAACILINKEKFLQVNGFNENLAVAYNDIDLCFKLSEAGYYNVIRNDAVLYHHESLSRGDDSKNPEKFKRLIEEQEKLYDMHKQFKGCDPYYNPNLTQINCDYSYNYESNNNYTVEVVSDVNRLNWDNSLIIGIDTKNSGWNVYIEGWAIRKGQNNNMDTYVYVVLYSDDIIYKISTTKVHRADVANAFKDESGIDFSGFRCGIDRDLIKVGKYKILIVYDDAIADSGEMIEKFIK